MRNHTDRSDIQHHADGLGAGADRVTLYYTLAGGLAGAAAGLGLWAVLSTFLPTWAGWGPALAGGVAVYGALTGLAIGMRECFRLQMEARRALSPR